MTLPRALRRDPASLVMHRAIYCAFSFLVFTVFTGCAHSELVRFPSANEFFITTGDADIQNYTPVGQLLYTRSGFRIPLPLLGFIPLIDVEPEDELRVDIFEIVSSLGGNGIINMYIVWDPPSNGFLGIGASGGRIAVYGTTVNIAR